ncbi:MAG: hypothetical protein PHS14_16750, partial [Elusimicrobia bacterium]|nr:hypothetical protein [Elusimicrobiota bacterium]
MKNLRIAHLADIHAKPEVYDLVRQSFEAVIADHKRSPFDLIAIAGDFWHGAIMDTARALFALFLDLVRQLADCAPVVFIYGTPSHDTEGSLEVFEQIRARYPIVILRPGLAYGLLRTSDDHAFLSQWDHETYKRVGDPDLLLFGIPEPNKKWLLAGAEATGKDDSDLAVRDAMKRLLLGLGGMRQQHSDLPCLVLYHGQVAGAKSATGFGVETGSGISVTQDDLAQIGADYYALGDIHEPQQIPGLPAYYPGSVYPGNWGETHKAGCNVVEINPGLFEHHVDRFGGEREIDRSVQVSRLAFPHPQRIKFSAPLADHCGIVDEDVKGKMVWAEITATREEAALFIPENLLDALQERGALPGSRVTLNILPTETVRAGEITEKKRLQDKIEVWAEASSLTAPESALKKADELERESAVLGSGQGAHIRIDRLRLRGAIGIWKKSKKDEIDLDLAALGPGVLALVGANGHGKTTILENLHPWPQMLTRDGTLKSHFRLKDSARELWFSDERTGWKYRALINIRADIESGAAEYFLFRDQGDGRGELPLDNVNGRKEPYEQAIAELFGSLEMYLQTAFVTQRPSKYAPDLGQATQGQRKALFGELSGIDYLDRYRVAAKTRADALDIDIRGNDERIAAAAGVDEEIQRLTTEQCEAGEKEKAATADAERAEGEGRTLAAEREALALRVAEADRKAERRRQLDREIEETSQAIAAIEEEVKGFSLAAEGRAAAAEELENIKALEARRDELRALKAKHDEGERTAAQTYQTTTAELRRKQDQARADVDDARARLSAAEQAEALARSKTDPEGEGKLEAARTALTAATEDLEHIGKASLAASAELEALRKAHAETRALAALVDELHDGQACPLCGGADHPQPAHADAEKLRHLEGEGKLAALRSTQASADLLEAGRAEERARANLEALETSAQTAKDAQEALAGLAAASQDARAAVDATQAVLDAIQIPPPPEPALFPGAAELEETELALGWTNRDDTEARLRDGEAAAVRIEEARRRQDDARQRQARLQEECSGLGEAGADERPQLEAKDREIARSRDRLTAAREAAAAARATVQAKAQALAGAQERKQARDQAKAERDTAAAELADWRFLERATGPDGIQ